MDTNLPVRRRAARGCGGLETMDRRALYCDVTFTRNIYYYNVSII